MTANRRNPRPKWQVALGAVVAVVLTASSLAGGWTYYHFYWAPTGVSFQSTGKKVYRAQLVDMVLEVAVKQNAVQPSAQQPEPAK